MNEAFEELKRVVPHFSSDFNSHESNMKLTKITTLRLAVNYIAALTKILDQTQSVNNSEVKVEQDRVNTEPVSLSTSDQSVIAAGPTEQQLLTLAYDPVVNYSEFENLLFNHRSSSLCSSDVPSCDSPSTTTETESLESFKSRTGWDFSADDSLDIPETFDLILESDENMQLSDDALI